MTLREMTLEQLRALHATELHEAFPPSELKPFAAMEALYRRGVYRPVGAYDEEELIGYVLLWDAPGGKYVLVDYLGVTAARRNRGLGGRILQMVGEQYSGYDGIIVESEAPEGGPADALRRRRMDFYRRAGFVFLDYDCALFGVHYAVCLNSPNGQGNGTDALAAHQALYQSQFPAWAYRKYIQIPLDPERPLMPPESWADQDNLPGLGEGRKEV